MGRLLEALDRHWFAPGSLRDLALARVVIVGFQLAVMLWPAVLNISPAASLRHQMWLSRIDSEYFIPLPALKLFMLPFGWGARPDPGLVAAFWWIAVAAGIAALLGLLTRPAMLLFAFTNTFLVAHAYSFGEYHHTEAGTIIVLWCLALSPCGRRLALGNRLRGGGGADGDDVLFAGWPLRAGQWVLALIYFSAGVSKLLYGGLTWFNGYTLAFYFAEDTLRFDAGWLGARLARHPAPLSALAVGAVAFELLFFIAVLVPRTAPFFLIAGAGMHLSIWVVHGPPFFQTMALYVVFIGALRALFGKKL